MAVLITFPDGGDWYVSNFGFELILQNYRIVFPHDPKMQHELEMVRAVGGIELGKQEPELARSIAAALERLAERVIAELPSDRTELVPKDRQTQEDHLVILRKLLPLVQHCRKALRTSSQ